MKMNYISKIKANMRRYKTIHTTLATSRVLDGSYNSIYKGRSMNFDELREYIPGDDIKDIDWKATSRKQKVMVRQYIAEKKHNIMLVMDTNHRMLADTAEAEEKREVAIMSAGTLAYLINSNGDYISAIYSTEKSIQHFPFRTGLPNIENILNCYHKEVTKDNDSNLEFALQYIAKNIHRKLILFIVTDLHGISKISDKTLKQLLLKQDVLVMNISDTKMTGKKVFDVENNDYVPAFISENKHLSRIEDEKQKKLMMECENKLKNNGIAMTTID
ncbi:MAG TPA: DUF58 domain-containing protein, partial [Lachnospiraceae bacterium]|nr:DUF58 domain-containing protein [Lachnospiraceae bacterium]